MICPIHSTFDTFDTHFVFRYPLGMGVSIVFHHVVNQPHTPFPHFASFPTRTPRLSLLGSIFYLHLRSIMNPQFPPQSVCPSANLPSFRLPHTETHQWGPHPSSVFQENYALRGPPISPWGTHFYICTFLPNYSLFIVQTPLFPVITLSFFCHLWRPASLLLAKRNLCRPWLEHYLSSTLACIVHIFRVPHRSLTSTRICSPCPASGTTYHRSCRHPDTRPRYTVAATFYLIHPPTKGSLESSHFLTSSMYLCHFLTSVDLTKPFAFGSRVPLLPTSAQFSERATIS
jgi:hypothetical protein